MESPTPLANRTNAADTPVDAKNILKTRLRPKPPTVLSPLAKDFEPMNDADDDSNDEDFVYDAAKEGKLKGASEQWTRGKRPNGIDDAAQIAAVLDAIDDLQRPEEMDADEMLEDASMEMARCAPAPPEELQEMEALEDANEEIESIEDAADAELLEDASAAVAAPGGPFEDVAVAPPAPPSPPRTRYPLLTRFMECIGSRM
jgi:hypothetical protein